MKQQQQQISRNKWNTGKKANEQRGRKKETERTKVKKKKKSKHGEKNVEENKWKEEINIKET